MNTSALEAKVSAVKLLSKLPENMGEAFTPYIEQTLPVVMQLCSFNLSKQIRKDSLKAIASMIGCLKMPLNCELFQKVYPMLKELTATAIANLDLLERKKLTKCMFHSMRNIHDSDKEHVGKPFMPVSEIEPLCAQMA